MMFYGLTGGIGSGKSEVSRIFASRGFEILDADRMTRQLHHDPDICSNLAQLFGPEVLDHSSDAICVNRRKLAEIVFNSKDALTALNQLMQPALYRALQIALNHCRHHAILDAALLFEAGWDKLVHKSIVVICPLQLRIERIKRRNGISESQIHARIAAQMSDRDRIRRADYIIYNTHDLDTLERQVNAICLQNFEYPVES